MKAVINLKRDNWSGWNKGESKSEESIVEVESGETLKTIRGMGSSFAKINNITEDSVTLITSHLAPIRNGGGIDLRGDYTNLETVLKKGIPVVFSTQSMDAGITYTLILKEIKP